MGFLEGVAAVLAWAYGLTGSFLLALIVVAVPLRLVLLPFYARELRSRRALAALQPQLEEIKARHGDDENAAAKEIIQLRQQHGAGMAGGCVGLIVLLVVFAALFFVLTTPLAYMGYTRTNRAWQARTVTGPLAWLQDSELADDLRADPESTTTVFGNLRLDCSTAHVATGSAPEGAPDCPEGGALALYLAVTAIFTALNVLRSRDPQPALSATARPLPMAAVSSRRPQLFPLLMGLFSVIFPLGLVAFWMTMSVLSLALAPLMVRSEPMISTPGTPPPAF